jgi:hypothetical protein
LNILFVHQNMPGQFKHLAPHLAKQGHRVVFLTQRKGVAIPGVETVTYAVPRRAGAQTHQYVRLFENCVIAGQEVVRQVLALRQRGFRPDIIVAHSGWGEALFLKDVCPRVPLLTYSEFYYRDQELHFEAGRDVSLDQVCRLRARNANLLLSLEACDAAIAPTRWQKSVQPTALLDKISVIFDGIDTGFVAPDAKASFTLDGAGDDGPEKGRVLTRADEVVTYVARNLEPYRGFPSFIRSLPRLLAERPNARVVIVGGDHVSYGSAPEGGSTWRETMLAEVPVPGATADIVSACVSDLSVCSVLVVHGSDGGGMPGDRIGHCAGRGGDQPRRQRAADRFPRTRRHRAHGNRCAGGGSRDRCSAHECARGGGGAIRSGLLARQAECLDQAASRLTAWHSTPAFWPMKTRISPLRIGNSHCRCIYPFLGNACGMQR